MSTTWPLDHGPNHHFFFDLCEPDTVFLTLSGLGFEARPGSVTVAIPLSLWERLKAVGIDPEFWSWDVDGGGTAKPDRGERSLP